MIAMRCFPALAVLLPLGLFAQPPGVRLARPFGEHMVLQQGVPITVWGTGCPGGDQVALYIAGQQAWTRCDYLGRWTIQLSPMQAGGPYQLLMEVGVTHVSPNPAATSRGGVEINDVLIGDVWLSAGPSDPPAASIPDAASPWIRVYRNGRWRLAARDTLSGYAAAGWSFANAQHDQLKIPIGIVDVPYAALAPYAVRGTIWNSPTEGPSGDSRPRFQTMAPNGCAPAIWNLPVPFSVGYRGPIYQSMTQESGAIRLRFWAPDGLKTFEQSLPGLTTIAGRGFTIAGDDRKFVEANALIDGDTVVVYSPAVASPVAVRYSYTGYPFTGLCDHADHPAAPFRTDAW